MHQRTESSNPTGALWWRCFTAGLAILIFGGLYLAWSDSTGARAIAADTPAATAPSVPDQFNHDATAFPLRGAHRILKCELCHVGGQYKNLPTQCDRCHNGQIAYGKPVTHVATTFNCDACHTDAAWSPATFRHDLGLTTGRCDTCHNGQIATAKPLGHLQTTAQCDFCHTTRTWTFTHTAATTAGQCDTCHNDQAAPGKPQGHFVTSLQCDMCHTSTTTWTVVSLSFHLPTRLIGGHTGVDCSTCHVVSTGSVIYRDGTTYGSCANCHTRDYQPGAEDHRTIQQDANCAACHTAYIFSGN